MPHSRLLSSRDDHRPRNSGALFYATRNRQDKNCELSQDIECEIKLRGLENHAFQIPLSGNFVLSYDGTGVGESYPRTVIRRVLNGVPSLPLYEQNGLDVPIVTAADSFYSAVQRLQEGTEEFKLASYPPPYTSN